MKYDVFISYSRKDYVDEHEVVKEDSPVKAILDFLDEHQITYWFDKEGIYSGSEFVEVIANAIADSKMMLFVSSEHSNESIYTAGEIFEAIENQQLIIPVKIDDSKYNKKFKLLLNPLDYIDITKADAFSDLLKAVENEKARIAKIEADEALRREELKKREWRKSVKSEILELVNELKKLKETRKALLESIYKKLRSIDVLQKKCPVCATQTDIETEYCQVCGWFFPTLTAIDSIGIDADKSAILLAQSRWENKNASNVIDLKNEIIRLRKENTALETSYKDLIEKGYSKNEDNNFQPSDVELKKWNWGAFFFGWIWGLAHGIKKQSFINLFLWFFLGIFAIFSNLYLGFYGNRLAWKAFKNSNWETFKQMQNQWKLAAFTLVCLLGCIILSVIIYNI